MDRRECIVSLEKIDPIIENIIEIAWCNSDLIHNNMYADDIDSLDEKYAIIELAQQFEKKNAERNWDMKGDYYEEIYNFVTKELLNRFGREQSSN